MCLTCGKETWVPRWHIERTKGGGKYCSVPCKNEGLKLKGPGSKFTRPDGYVIVYFPSHPDATARGWVLEHRLVMEQKLGRRLTRDEQVHHENGIKDDNRPENLSVLNASEHTRITLRTRHKRLAADLAELAEYRRRYGPLT